MMLARSATRRGRTSKWTSTKRKKVQSQPEVIFFHTRRLSLNNFTLLTFFPFLLFHTNTGAGPLAVTPLNFISRPPSLRPSLHSQKLQEAPRDRTEAEARQGHRLQPVLPRRSPFPALPSPQMPGAQNAEVLRPQGRAQQKAREQHEFDTQPVKAQTDLLRRRQQAGAEDGGPGGGDRGQDREDAVEKEAVEEGGGLARGDEEEEDEDFPPHDLRQREAVLGPSAGNSMVHAIGV